MTDSDNQNNSFSVNFSMPSLITPKDTFSSGGELKSEWNDIVEKEFPKHLSDEVEKDKLLSASIDEVNWDGENFEFKFEETNFNNEEKMVVAYILARSVQKEHYLPENKIEIEIITGEKKTKVYF